MTQLLVEVLVGEDLVELLLVLDDGHHGIRIGQDVLDLVGAGVRVDGRRGASSAGDGVVGEDPFEAGRRVDRDALLRLEAELDEAGCEIVDDLLRFSPRVVDPLALLITIGLTEGMTVRRHRNALPEVGGEALGRAS